MCLENKFCTSVSSELASTIVLSMLYLYRSNKLAQPAWKIAQMRLQHLCVFSNYALTKFNHQLALSNYPNQLESIQSRLNNIEVIYRVFEWVKRVDNARTCSDKNSQKEYLFFFRESQEDDLSELVSFDGMVNEVFQPHVPIIGKETKKQGIQNVPLKKTFGMVNVPKGEGPPSSLHAFTSLMILWIVIVHILHPPSPPWLLSPDH